MLRDDGVLFNARHRLLAADDRDAWIALRDLALSRFARKQFRGG